MQDELCRRLPRLLRNKKQIQPIPTVLGLVFRLSFDGKIHLEYDVAPRRADLPPGGRFYRCCSEARTS